jgi:membrane protein YdbS with pleckstrin-like domain
MVAPSDAPPVKPEGFSASESVRRKFTMPIGILFWVLYVVAIVFTLWSNYVPNQPNWYRAAGAAVIFWILIGILGWHAFGPVVR